MPDEIQQLSAAMAAGDSAAVAEFYQEYFDWMYIQARLASRRDEAFCLDVVQDAVLRVMRTVRQVESEQRFKAWLRLVVQTTAFDLLRNSRRREVRETAITINEVQFSDDTREQLDWLAVQMNRLDSQLVKIIELRFEQRWTLRRIGAAIGITTGAVDGRLRRALIDLRRSAKETFDLEDAAAMHDDAM